MCRCALATCGCLLLLVPVAGAELLIPGHTTAHDGQIVPGAVFSFDLIPDDIAVGDVNSDGYADVAVGYEGHSENPGPGNSEGVVYVFHGGPAGLGSRSFADADTVIHGDQNSSDFGARVALLDLNGDTHLDLVIAAPRYDDVLADEGVAFVFHGSASGFASQTPSSADATIRSDVASGELGWAESARDVNNDGYDDVILGMSNFGPSAVLAVFVFHGSVTGVTSGTAASADTVFEGTRGASSAGDVNGDGFDDIVAASRVLLGSATGIPGGTTSGTPKNYANAAFGTDACDVDRDGYSDVIMSEFVASTLFSYAFPGGPGGIGIVTAADAIATWQGTGNDVPFIECAGDVSGDARTDVIARRPLSSTIGGLLYLGKKNGIRDGGPTAADASLHASDGGGVPIGLLQNAPGDVNGDGIDDLIVQTDEDIRIYHGTLAAIPLPSLDVFGLTMIATLLFGAALARLGSRGPTLERIHRHTR